MKKSGFNFFSNLMVFIEEQIERDNVVIKMANTKHYVANNCSAISFAFKLVSVGGWKVQCVRCIYRVSLCRNQ